MASLKQLSDRISVGPQISVADVAELAQAGIVTLINNRPDGEDQGQPASAEIAAAAEQAGMSYHHIPIASGGVTPQAVEAMTEALDAADGPAFAFCRSGTRSTMLWALSQAGRQPADDIVAAASAAGYDVNSLRPYLEGMDPSR